MSGVLGWCLQFDAVFYSLNTREEWKSCYIMLFTINNHSYQPLSPTIEEETDAESASGKRCALIQGPHRTLNADGAARYSSNLRHARKAVMETLCNKNSGAAKHVLLVATLVCNDAS
jgi:hypothetical protein